MGRSCKCSKQILNAFLAGQTNLGSGHPNTAQQLWTQLISRETRCQCFGLVESAMSASHPVDRDGGNTVEFVAIERIVGVTNQGGQRIGERSDPVVFQAANSLCRSRLVMEDCDHLYPANPREESTPTA